MLEQFNGIQEMKYQKLSLEEQQQRGILGRLVGIIADFKNPTRNGRKYTEALWEKVFDSPIMKEKLENRCLFGELGHPTDRQEIDMEKIAICLAEYPQKIDGNLHGVFDILSTPNGRILKTLCDYGCKIGVSSRGSGDTFVDYDGEETVDPDTFECECWDAVLLPAVKSARPVYVNESLQTTKTLKKALLEALDNSTESERKTMTETLDTLDIDYSTEQVLTPEKVDNIDSVALDPDMAADDVGANLMKELQESLLRQQELEKQLKMLQEKLSVCYTKEARYADVLSRTKNELTQSHTTRTQLMEQVTTLESDLSKSKELISSLEAQNKGLTERLTKGTSQRQSLTESLATKDTEISNLNSKIKTLSEDYTKRCNELQQQNKQLTESLEDSKKDSQILRNQASAKLTKSKELVERYKTIAKTAIDRYINLQATRLGVTPTEIKNKLNENYSFNDIDAVCESLQKYKLTLNSLPFNVSRKEPVKMKIRESKEVIIPTSDNGMFDDDVDDVLKRIIG